MSGLLVPAWHNLLCTPLANTVFSDIQLVAWNQLRWEYLHCGNRWMLQIRAPFVKKLDVKHLPAHHLKYLSTGPLPPWSRVTSWGVNTLFFHMCADLRRLRRFLQMPHEVEKTLSAAATCRQFTPVHLVSTAKPIRLTKGVWGTRNSQSQHEINVYVILLPWVCALHEQAHATQHGSALTTAASYQPYSVSVSVFGHLTIDGGYFPCQQIWLPWLQIIRESIKYFTNLPLLHI